MHMARLRGLSGAAENFHPMTPTSGAISGLVRPSSNILSAFTTPDYRQSISPEATARSIAERRKAIGGVNPDFQFGNMGDYGLPNLGGEVQAYQDKIGGDRLGRENQLMQLLTNQMQEASKPLYQGSGQGPGVTDPTAPAPTATAAPAAKGTPWWKKILKVAAVAAPIVAAPFTAGASLAIPLAIGAGAGALSGALDGGKKGALMGAGLGALTSGIGGGAAGAGAKKVLGESAGSAIKRAVLNPRAIASMAGAGIGGTVGGTLSAVSPFLPGAKPGVQPTLFSDGGPLAAPPSYKPQISTTNPNTSIEDIMSQLPLGPEQQSYMNPPTTASRVKAAIMPPPAPTYYPYAPGQRPVASEPLRPSGGGWQSSPTQIGPAPSGMPSWLTTMVPGIDKINLNTAVPGWDRLGQMPSFPSIPSTAGAFAAGKVGGMPMSPTSAAVTPFAPQGPAQNPSIGPAPQLPQVVAQLKQSLGRAYTPQAVATILRQRGQTNLLQQFLAQNPSLATGAR